MITRSRTDHWKFRRRSRRHRHVRYRQRNKGKKKGPTRSKIAYIDPPMAPLSTCVISSEWYNSPFWRRANPSIFGLLETNELENHDEKGEQPTSTNLRSGEKPNKGRSEKKEKKERKGIEARGPLSSNFPPSTGNILESDIHTRVLQDTRGEHTPTQIYSRGNYHKDLLLIDSGASNSVIFNRLFLGPL